MKRQLGNTFNKLLNQEPKFFFHITEKFTIDLNSEKYIKYNIKHTRNSTDGEVTTRLPNSASCTEESLCMQLSDTRSLNSFSNREQRNSH